MSGLYWDRARARARVAFSTCHADESPASPRLSPGAKYLSHECWCHACGAADRSGRGWLHAAQCSSAHSPYVTTNMELLRPPAAAAVTPSKADPISSRGALSAMFYATPPSSARGSAVQPGSSGHQPALRRNTALLAACCLLGVGSCTLHVACCVLRVVHSRLHVVCCALHVAWSVVACCTHQPAPCRLRTSRPSAPAA